jgi:DNA-binding NtrC family response regulator
MSDPIEVLVLDDEEIVCEQLKHHMEKRDFRVETFCESNKALDRLAEKDFDVVITDLKMQGPTGLDVLHIVRNRGTGTQVIMITGYATIEAAREADYGGVYKFITKPFQLDAVAKMAKSAGKKARRLKR